MCEYYEYKNVIKEKKHLIKNFILHSSWCLLNLFMWNGVQICRAFVEEN